MSKFIALILTLIVVHSFQWGACADAHERHDISQESKFTSLLESHSSLLAAVTKHEKTKQELESWREIALKKLPRGLHYYVYRIVAFELSEIGEKSSSASELEKSLSLRANQPKLIFLLANIQLEKGSPEKALSLYNEALWRGFEPANEVYYRISLCFKALKMPQKEFAALKKAYDLQSNYPPVVRALLELELSGNLDTEEDLAENNDAKSNRMYVYLQVLIDSGDRRMSLVRMYSEEVLRRANPAFDDKILARVQDLMLERLESPDAEEKDTLISYRIMRRRRLLDEAQEVLQSYLRRFPDSQTIKQVLKTDFPKEGQI